MSRGKLFYSMRIAFFGEAEYAENALVSVDFSEESDLDLLIVLENNDWRMEKEIYGVCFEISLKYDVLLSPIIFSQVEFNNDLTRITSFYKVVTQEGITL